MRGLDPRIHAFLADHIKTWMGGTSPAMTAYRYSAASVRRSSFAAFISSCSAIGSQS